MIFPFRLMISLEDKAAPEAVTASGRSPSCGRYCGCPGAEAAAREAAGRLGVDPGEILVGDAATRERVLTGLGQATWAHFGCHATSDPRQPSSGTLHLPSGETLTVREIFAGRSGTGRTGTARLAFLTACGTARTSERLASEAIHLTSAFLVAGFTEAIGTLWEIDSLSARQVTSAFYERVTGPSPEPPAVALHHCARQIRRQRPGQRPLSVSGSRVV
jgi:CHAT domain-containing protein